MAAGRAELTAKIDDLLVQVVPALPREEAFQVFLGLDHVLAVGQPPAVGEAVDVGVDGEGGLPEGLLHHHLGRLVTHSR